MEPNQDRPVTCEMYEIEDGDLDIAFQCSACDAVHKSTKKFERSTECPACGAEITDWVFPEDDD